MKADEKTMLADYKESFLLSEKFDSAKRLITGTATLLLRNGEMTNEDFSKACLYAGKLYSLKCIQSIRFCRYFDSKSEFDEFTEKYASETVEYVDSCRLEMVKDVFRGIFGEENYNLIKDLSLNDCEKIWEKFRKDEQNL